VEEGTDTEAETEAEAIGKQSIEAARRKKLRRRI
jgi:hypothetical protein